MKLLGVIPLLISTASATCDRIALAELTNRYVAAQSLGEIRYLKGISPNTIYHENFKSTNISSGILTTPLNINHHRSTHDTTFCASYTELIIADRLHPYVIATQIWLSPNFTSSPPGNSSSPAVIPIAKIDSIITTTDDWLFNAQHTLHYALTESWLPLSPSLITPRETIRAAADAYLDLFKSGPGSVVVPWNVPCQRLEGGLYTAPGDTCNNGVPSGVDLVERRYVIDESVGSVSVFLVFGGGGARLPDSHEFRVEGGKIRYVHTVTKCWEKNCGFGDPPAILGENIGF